MKVTVKDTLLWKSNNKKLPKNKHKLADTKFLFPKQQDFGPCYRLWILC